VLETSGNTIGFWLQGLAVIVYGCTGLEP